MNRLLISSRLGKQLLNKSILIPIRWHSPNTKSWLINEKKIDSEVADGIIKAFGGSPPSISDLEAFGQAGLDALVDSVKKEVALTQASKQKALVHITIQVPHEKTTLDYYAREGQTLYHLVNEYQELNQFLECVCGGIEACSTCHVIVNPKYFSKLPKPDDSELDILDLAWGLTDTSRLGCQLKLTKDIDGIEVTIPKQANNLYG